MPYSKETQIAQQSFSSAANFELVAKRIDFPRIISGKRFLDIGSGGSDAAIELTRRGAFAVAVDPLLTDPQRLADAVEGYISEQYFHDPKLPDLSGRQAYVAQQRKTLQKVLSSIDNGNGHYVAASAGSLPFKNSSFDFVYSLQAVSFFMFPYPGILMKAIDESLRVLKPLGQLQLHPWTESKHLPPDQRETAEMLFRILGIRGLKHSIEPTQLGASPRLRIIKSTY